jgi:hypothetical protein
VVLQDARPQRLRADLHLVLDFRVDDDEFVLPIFRPAHEGFGKEQK